MTAVDLATAVDRLLTRIAHWEQSRWSAPGGPGTRADLVYALVQRLADLGAAAAGTPPRVVPRVGDLVLPDQLRVVADDLLDSAKDDQLDAALHHVQETAQAL